MISYNNYSYNIPYGSSKTNVFYYVKIILTKLSYIILMIISIIFLNLYTKQTKLIENLEYFVDSITKPSFIIVNKTYDKVYSIIDFINEIFVLRYNNITLRKENEELKYQLIENKHLESENEDLKDIVNFISYNQTQTFATVKPTYVIRNKFTQKLKIEKSPDLKLNEGDFAFDSKGYFIGKVINVLDKSAEILLITDKSSRIPAIISSSKVKVILGGTNTNYLEIVNYFGNNLELKEGDLLFSIKDGDVVSDNFFIGKVIKEGNDLKIKVNDNFNYLNIVFIAQYKE